MRPTTTVASGPYASPAPPLAGSSGYPNAVYYCSQNIIQVASSLCARSDTGGQTWNPSTTVFGGTSPCGAISGHLKIARDGTVYLPQFNCSHPNGDSGQGMAVSRDNGQTWTYSVVKGSSARPNGSGTDPSIGIGAKGSVYFGFENGNGHPMIGVTHDRGNTWSKPVDVGASLGIQNTKFPEVVAGDDNRAAFAFLGTTSAGDDQSATFPGVWYVYVSMTFDGGRHWVTANASPGNVIQRGCIWNGGGSNACRNLLDFNDIGVDQNGRVYVAYTDGCKDINFSYQTAAGGAQGQVHGPSNCNSDPNSYKDTDKVSFDGLARQTCGEGLYERHDKDFAESCPTPRVVKVSPVDGATKVPRTVTPTATFDVSLTTRSFTLTRQGGGSVAGTLTCDRECHVLTFHPNSVLAANTTYRAVASGGNAQGGRSISWSFKTGP